jgi:ParB family chromosome partitioning protein
MNNKIISLHVNDILIGKRIRKNINLDLLKTSMKAIGQLQPIIVDNQYQLVAGYRRLAVARDLGWETIDVLMLDTGNKKMKLLIEMDENITRQDFTEDELQAGYSRIRRYSKGGAFWKIVNWIIG